MLYGFLNKNGAKMSHLKYLGLFMEVFLYGNKII